MVFHLHNVHFFDPGMTRRVPSAPPHPHRRRTASRLAILAALGMMLSLLLASCAAPANTPHMPTSPTDTNALPEPPTSPFEFPTTPTEPPVQATDAELRAYYEELLTSLRETLLAERLEHYISDHEYKSRLEALQKDLALLMSGAELESSQAVSGTPTPPHQEQTSPPEKDTLPSPPTPPQPDVPSTAFRYGISHECAVIYEYLGSSRTVSVPSRIDGYPVVAIADSAFRGTQVTSVILPDTVTSIGWFAFSGCKSLESITLPATVTSISYAAFDECPALMVLCPRDSYAARWAASYGLRVQYI